MTNRAQLRRYAAISLRELARKTGISRSRLHRFEHDLAELDPDEIVHLAAILGANLERIPSFSSHEQLTQALSTATVPKRRK